MSAPDDLTVPVESEAEAMERLGWTALAVRWGPHGDAMVGYLRLAVVNEINCQVGGGDLATLAERLGVIEERVQAEADHVEATVAVWRELEALIRDTVEGGLKRGSAIRQNVADHEQAIGGIHTRIRTIERWIEGDPDADTESEAAQAPAERRTGEKLNITMAPAGFGSVTATPAAPVTAPVMPCGDHDRHSDRVCCLPRGHALPHRDQRDEPFTPAAPVASGEGDLVQRCRIAARDISVYTNISSVLREAADRLERGSAIEAQYVRLSRESLDAHDLLDTAKVNGVTDPVPDRVRRLIADWQRLQDAHDDALATGLDAVAARDDARAASDRIAANLSAVHAALHSIPGVSLPPETSAAEGVRAVGVMLGEVRAMLEATRAERQTYRTDRNEAVLRNARLSLEIADLHARLAERPAPVAVPVEGERERERLAAWCDRKGADYRQANANVPMQEYRENAETFPKIAALLRALPEGSVRTPKPHRVVVIDALLAAYRAGEKNRTFEVTRAADELLAALVPASVGTAWSEAEKRALRDALFCYVSRFDYPQNITEARSALARLERGEALPYPDIHVAVSPEAVDEVLGGEAPTAAEPDPLGIHVRFLSSEDRLYRAEAGTWWGFDVANRTLIEREAPAVGAEAVAWRRRARPENGGYWSEWDFYRAEPRPGALEGWEAEVQPLGVIGTREPGAPSVGATTLSMAAAVDELSAERDRLANNLDIMLDENHAAHAALTAAGVPLGTLVERVEALAKREPPEVTEYLTSLMAAAQPVADMLAEQVPAVTTPYQVLAVLCAAHALLAQRAPEGERLTFDALRRANLARLPHFKTRHGTIAHSETDGSDWSPAQWLQAVVGEVGEYANLRKKYERGDLDAGEFYREAADELADVATYLDILAYQIGVDLGAATASKWDRISERVGFAGRIADYRIVPPEGRAEGGEDGNAGRDAGVGDSSTGGAGAGLRAEPAVGGVEVAPAGAGEESYEGALGTRDLRNLRDGSYAVVSPRGAINGHPVRVTELAPPATEAREG